MPADEQVQLGGGSRTRRELALAAKSAVDCLLQAYGSWSTVPVANALRRAASRTEASRTSVANPAEVKTAAAADGLRALRARANDFVDLSVRRISHQTHG